MPWRASCHHLVSVKRATGVAKPNLHFPVVDYATVKDYLVASALPAAFDTFRQVVSFLVS